MKRRDAFRKFPLVIIGLTSVCTVVFSNTRVSIFRVATFQNGNIIVIKGGITSVLACVRTCGDTCGYVQYRADDACVLYSDADLVTKSAAVEGAIQGYRKVSGIHICFPINVCSEPDRHTTWICHSTEKLVTHMFY